MKLKANVRFHLEKVRNGKTVARTPKQTNLLLDSGLNGLNSNTWAESFDYAVIGTGDSPTRRNSGAVSASLTGGTVTADAAFFEAADVGRSFKMTGGPELRISAFTSSTQVDVETIAGDAPDDAASAAFAVFHVTDSILDSESKRTNNYATDTGDNGTSYDGGTVTFKRTFLFSEEAGAVTYREIGWSPTSGVGTDLFGRALLAAPFAVAGGEQVKAVVELDVAISPVSQLAVDNVSADPGFDTSGTAIIASKNLSSNSFDSVFGSVTSSGASLGYGFFDPNRAKSVQIVSADWTQPTEPQAITPQRSCRTQKDVPGVYTADRFKKIYSFEFETTESNGDAYGVVFSGSGNDREHYSIKFDTLQNKGSDYKLGFNFVLEWRRTLTD